MKICTSLSCAIMDIMAGKVALKDVSTVYAGTCMENREQAAKVLSIYQERYWPIAKEKSSEIFWLLWDSGKIIQPRVLFGYESDTVYHGPGAVWFDSEEKFITAQCKSGREDLMRRMFPHRF